MQEHIVSDHWTLKQPGRATANTSAETSAENSSDNQIETSAKTSADKRPDIPAGITAFLASSGANGDRQLIEDLLVLGSEGNFPGPLSEAVDPCVEPRHARIERRGAGFVIRDLRSNGGTFVNGTRIVEAHLQSGDIIRLGGLSSGFSTVFFLEQANASVAPTHRLKSRNLLWQAQIDRLPGMASSDYPILLLGPSGSGKEILAETIHSLSKRSPGPFTRVNCSALSETLIESELFGHVKGSFTGAIGDRKGAFETARGGTLFLDEIGDFPYGLQAKLLRALENNEVRPVGSDRLLQTDVR
ncbi:MAG: hypothetical protein C5B49_08245, partial [Bdellovibrio sp.]